MAKGAVVARILTQYSDKGTKAARKDFAKMQKGSSDFSSKAAKGFALAAAAAATYAAKVGYDAVKAAMADEVSQQRLATTLQNVAGATNEQIAAVEKWVTANQLALGVADSEIRPAFERLARATKDVGDAQALTTLALDIAAGSGKSLEQVAQALGRGYEGNLTALGKLGVGIDKATLKSASFDQITAQLAATFAGQASKKADTFQGKLNRLSEAFSEAKETVGGFLMSALQPVLDFAVKHLIPGFQKVADKVGEVLSPVFMTMVDNFQQYTLPMLKDLWHWFEIKIAPALKDYIVPAIEKAKKAFNDVNQTLRDNQDELRPLIELFKWVAEVLAKVLIPLIGKNLLNAIDQLSWALSGIVKTVGYIVEKTVKNIENAVNIGINAINKLIDAYNKLPFKNVDRLTPVSFTMTPAKIQASRELSAQVPTAVTEFSAAADKYADYLKDLSNVTTNQTKETKKLTNALKKEDPEIARMKDLIFKTFGIKPDTNDLNSLGAIWTNLFKTNPATVSPTISLAASAGAGGSINSSVSGNNAPGITINVAGSVVSDADLVALVQNGLDTLYQRSGTSKLGRGGTMVV